jgi:hypothetical protein
MKAIKQNLGQSIFVFILIIITISITIKEISKIIN